MQGQIFVGGAGVASGIQTGSINAIDVGTGKVIVQHATDFPMYAGVLATSDLLWAGSLDGTFAAYDAKTLEEKWSMKTGTAFQAPPIAFNVAGKEYIAIVGGGVGIAAFGRPELEVQAGITANVLWVFTVN